MRIGELAEKTGASVRSLRYYERAGLIRARREGNGYRDFSPELVEQVGRIKAMPEGGLNLKDVRLLYPCVEKQENGEPLCEAARERYLAKLSEVEARIGALQRVRSWIHERLEDTASEGVREQSDIPARNAS